jgi:hypothetical protein
MGLFSNMSGALKGAYFGFKNGGNISKYLEDTQAVANIFIGPIRNKNSGYIPNKIYTDSFLIGFIFKFSALYLLFSGVKEPFLLKKIAIQVTSTAIDIEPVALKHVMDNISRNVDELKQFEMGGLLAEKTYELFLKRDKTATLGITEYLNKTYQLLPF